MEVSSFLTEVGLGSESTLRIDLLETLQEDGSCGLVADVASVSDFVKGALDRVVLNQWRLHSGCCHAQSLVFELRQPYPASSNCAIEMG